MCNFKRNTFVPTIMACAILSACGGGGGGDKAVTGNTTPSSAPTPITAATAFTANGLIGPGPNLMGSLVTAYDSVGKPCGTSVPADATGKYSISGKCTFPIVLYADLPDGNDEFPLPEDAKGEGRKYFNFVSEITSKGQNFTLNLTPITSIVTDLALGRQPVIGVANTKTVLNEARRADAEAKVAESLKVFAETLQAVNTNYSTADISEGSPLSKLLKFVQISYERVDSTKQNYIRFHAPSEHRPVVLVATDGKPIADAYIDSGLGVAADTVDKANLQIAYDTNAEIQAMFTKNSSYSSLPLDSCYLHNGSKILQSLFDVPVGWAPDFKTSFENIRLLRLNTYADFSNETLEQRNPGKGTLAFISFDFRNKHGLKQRAYTWLIKGSQDVQGCTSNATGWRILGNQRPVYVRTDTIAVHETLVSQQFGSRKDLYGSGTEHYLANPSTAKYTHILVNGPGLPDDGVVFIRGDVGSYLYSTTTLLKIRAGYLSGSPKWYDAIFRTIKDTRAYMMNDTQIKTISDSYFDGQQNVYVYRFFGDFPDLYPTLTLQDVLPKRPYLSTEIPVTYFPSLALNIDNLIQALQLSNPVALNWSLPLDLRQKRMLPETAWFSRLNCIPPKKWPSCTDRIDQFNEYDISPEYYSTVDISSTSLVPTAVPGAPTTETSPVFTPYTTFKGYARLRLLDSLNRPIETRVGMDYTR